MRLLLVSFVAACFVAYAATAPPEPPSADELRLVDALEAALARGHASYSHADALDAYRQGRYDDALPLLLTLARDGHAPAARLLSAAHAHGRGVEPDSARAAHWLHEAARLGDASARWEVMGR